MATRQEGDPARNPVGETEQSWGAWGWGGGGRRAGASPYYPGAQQDYYQQQQQGYYQQQQRPVARGFFAPWNSREDRRGSWSGWPF
jgi:hypothetical protein